MRIYGSRATYTVNFPTACSKSDSRRRARVWVQAAQVTAYALMRWDRPEFEYKGGEKETNGDRAGVFVTERKRG